MVVAISPRVRLYCAYRRFAESEWRAASEDVVFGESLKVQTLGVRIGGPPGTVPGGTLDWRAVSRVLRSRAQTVACDLLTSVFPGDCRVCGGPLLFGDDTRAVCSRCVDGVRAQGGVLCGCCGEAMGMESERFATQMVVEDLRCMACRMAPPDFERAVAYGVYEDELRKMLRLLKYEGVRSLAGVLGGRLASAMEGLGIDREMIVVPVPLFPKKERARGYNQAVLLADAAVRVLAGRMPEWRLRVWPGALERVRDTESQFGLTPRGRRKNLRGAFAVSDGAALAGSEVLLVDDIYTSGATARECARVLRRAGAARVWVATLARAQTEGVARWDAVWTAGRTNADSLRE